MERFCKAAYKFKISIAIQIKERFRHFKNPIYDAAKALKIENAMSKKYHEENPNAMKTLFKVFIKLADNEHNQITLQNEWDLLLTLPDIPTELKSFNTNIEDVWFYLMADKRVAHLSMFALFVLCTPHANGSPERMFSAQKLCKTKNRNHILVETVGGTSHAKQAVQANSDNVLEPTAEMINELLRRKYYKNKYADRKLI